MTNNSNITLSDKLLTERRPRLYEFVLMTVGLIGYIAFINGDIFRWLGW